MGSVIATSQLENLVVITHVRMCSAVPATQDWLKEKSFSTLLSLTFYLTLFWGTSRYMQHGNFPISWQLVRNCSCWPGFSCSVKKKRERELSQEAFQFWRGLVVILFVSWSLATDNLECKRNGRSWRWNRPFSCTYRDVSCLCYVCSSIKREC